MFDKPITIINSGVFICQPILYTLGAEIASPFVESSSSLELADSRADASAESFTEQHRNSNSVFTVSQATLTQYAGKLLEVSRIIKESQYDVVLCPLRGARMAGLQANLVCKSEPFRGFDGADMAQGVNDARILADLRRLIHEAPLANERRRIGVLDTAVGGDSCCELARLLRQLNDEGREAWDVKFHLVHADDRQPPRAAGAYRFNSARLQIEILYHPVISLLIEDEPSLLGYDVKRGGGESHIVRMQRDGQLLIHGPGIAKLYRQAPLDEAMITLVSEEVKKLIQEHPEIKPVSLDEPPRGIAMR